MIDCLSSPAWINPQIDCLLFLQNYRTGVLEHFDKLFLSITIFGEFWLPTLVCAITYWCIDFKAGIYLCTLEGLNIFMAHFFKMIACVYRPWVLDSRVHPSELAIPFAKGYSCPSGHSAMSSSVLGGVAFLIRKHKILCTLLILTILLVGFSRLWLGVHTPQDVFFGFLIGIILIFAVQPLINWAEKDSNRYLYLLGIMNILAILALIFIGFFNTYRMDYIGNELLVNPQKQLYVTIVVYAYTLGFLNGCFLCRRFFPFNPKEVSLKRRILRGLIGGTAILFVLKFVLSNIVINIISLKIALPVMFLIGISITLIYPIIFIHSKKI